MFELLSGGLLGSIFGGIFRLAPEVLKFLDKKNERQHELSMFQLQTDLEKLRGEFRMEEKYVDYSVQQLDTIKSAFEEQAETAKEAGKFVAESLPWYVQESPGQYLECTQQSRRLRLFLHFKAMRRGMKSL